MSKSGSRRKLLYTLGALLVLLLAVTCAKHLWDYRSLNLYDPDVEDDVAPVDRETRDGYVREVFSFQALAGEHIPVRAAIPAGDAERWPAVILFYGSGMNMGFAKQVDHILAGGGFALFVPEQYNRGRRRLKDLNLFGEIVAARRRVFITGQEMRRLVDVISRRPDVDPDRIYFWGASFGAIVCCKDVKKDPRLKACVFTLSGGDLPTMIRETPYRSEVPGWAYPLVWTVAWLLAPVDPVRHVDGIAPRPMLFQNTRRDDLIPVSCVEALYREAGQPKELVWYDVTHNYIQKSGAELLLRDGVKWLAELDRQLVNKNGTNNLN